MSEYPKPIIEEYEGFYVVRDDLLEYGSKIRFIDSLIKDLPQNEIVFGSSPRWGYGQISLSYVCKKYNKKFTLFLAEGQFHEYTKRALELGANIIQVPMGFLATTQKRARDYVAEDAESRFLFPIGIEHPSVLDAIKDTASSTGFNPDHVWTASSSGTLHRGLSMAWPNAEIHAVSVGHAMDERQRGRAIIHECKYKFQQVPKKHELPPFPAAAHYEAKVWKILQETYSIEDRKRLKILLWNVGR